MNTETTNTKRNKARKIFAIVISIILIIVIAILSFYLWYTSSVYSSIERKSNSYFEVKEGETLNGVADSLEKDGVIKSALALKIYLKINNKNILIKPGKYSIPNNYTPLEFIDLLAQGKPKEFVTVRIREASRYEQISSDIYSYIFAGSEDKSLIQFDTVEFNRIAENPDSYTFSSNNIKDFLQKYKPAGKSLRGFLYPDTYNFNTDIKSIEAVEIMLENFIDKVTKAYDLSTITGYTFYQRLTLASIIEKEASSAAEKPIIAGIFYNRLDDNYLLQSDATVNFITGKNDPGASFQDIKIDNPYNTYKYPGLPPTPINDPTLTSIMAALNPNKNDYYYFRHDSKGKGYYSKTYQEHQDSIIMYP